MPIIRFLCGLTLLSTLALPVSYAADDAPAGVVILNDNGAWSWFEDERAIIDPVNGKFLVSSVADNAGSGGAARNGDIEVASLDLTTLAVDRFTLHENLQADDHNSAALIVRPDGRYLAMYGQHIGSTLSYYRVSTGAGTTTSWGPTQSFNNGVSMTYSNLHYLPDDAGGAGRMYNFTRTNNFDPNVLTSSDGGSTWTYGGKLLTEGGGSDRPYVRYFSDGQRIHLITTQRHPRDFDNSVFYGYVEDGQLFNAAGAVVDSNLFDASGVAPAALTPIMTAGTVVDGAAMRRMWTVDVAVDAASNPVAVYQARANGLDTDHRYFYSRWNGTQWVTNQLAFAGSYLYGSENDYTGLVAIDPDDVNTVYVSSEVHPETKALLIGADGVAHYELFRGRTTDGGANWSWSPITLNSTRDNLRPIVPKWDVNNAALAWFRGTYSTYTEYDTDVVALINPDIADPELAVQVDFGLGGQLTQPGYTTFSSVANPFGESVTSFIASDFAATGTDLMVTVGGDVSFRDRGDDVNSPLGDLADDYVYAANELTLTIGNLARGSYHLVLYSHDRDTTPLTLDIRQGNADLGTLVPTSGANPAIGIASARVAFGASGEQDVVFTLDGLGTGEVVLNGFELYYIGDLIPPYDLNGDGELTIADYSQLVAGMQVDLTGLTTNEAYLLGDLNGDFRNDFADFRLFKNAYDQWHGAGALASALSVPEPSTLIIGVVAVVAYPGGWYRLATLVAGTSARS